MDLRLTNGTVLETASGDFESKGREVEIEPAFPGGSATLTGTVMADRVIGKLNGGVVIDGTGCTNNHHAWTFTPH